jgi:hypothetical protein
MLAKHFQVNITIRCTSADVVALAGSFAEHVEANHAAAVDSIEVNSHVYASKPYTTATTLSPAIEPVPVPEPPVQGQNPPPTKPARKAGRVKPEIREVSIPVTDLHLDTVADLNAMAEAQGELPLPEVEGAEVEVTLEEPAEVIEPAPASTRELTRDDVFEALRALLTDYGNAAAKAALSTVGQAKFSDVPTDKLGDLFESITAYRKDRE